MSVLVATDAVTSSSAPIALGSFPGIGAFLRTDIAVISLLVFSVALLAAVIVLAAKSVDRRRAEESDESAESDETAALISTAELPAVGAVAATVVSTAPLPAVPGANESAARYESAAR